VSLDHAEVHVRDKMRAQLEQLTVATRSMRVARTTTVEQAAGIREEISDLQAKMKERVDLVCEQLRAATKSVVADFTEYRSGVNAAEEAGVQAYAEVEPQLEAAVRSRARLLRHALRACLKASGCISNTVPRIALSADSGC
jgi:uncharacterized coiled-coil DUF342 family protein